MIIELIDGPGKGFHPSSSRGVIMHYYAGYANSGQKTVYYAQSDGRYSVARMQELKPSL